MKDLNKIREHIKNESPEYKKQMKIYILDIETIHALQLYQ